MSNSTDITSKVKGFVNRNIVLFVMVPMLISVHWGWFALQRNPNLVDQSQRTNPFSIALKYISGTYEGDKSKKGES